MTAEFAAAHAIVIGGEREPVHGHNWRVRAVVAGRELDGDGLLCDFHEVERELRSIVERHHNRSLNETPPFDRVNPTAEHVAREIGAELRRRLSGRLGKGVRVSRVSVTEAPGCEATAIFGE